MKKLTHEALDNALANGYVLFLRESPKIIAQDLVDCCSDLENVNPEEIEIYVVDWQNKASRSIYF